MNGCTGVRVIDGELMLIDIEPDDHNQEDDEPEKRKSLPFYLKAVAMLVGICLVQIFKYQGWLRAIFILLVVVGILLFVNNSRQLNR